MKTLAKAIALAATMGAAASANAAISLNHNGLGEALIFPSYTVENGNDTAISVTNTTNEYKVVKVRFREALNSQDVLDFHLFLSPKDVWNGVVVAADNGGAKLITRDTSCTVPAIPADGAFFSDLAYGGRAIETALRGEDGGPQDLKRTRTGYVEIIELGILNSATVLTQKVNGNDVTMAAAIKHVNGVPGNCGAVVAEYRTGRWKDTPPNNFSFGFKGVADIAASTAGGLGGLYGVGTITNVFSGQQLGYDATAIDGFISLVDGETAGGTAIGNLHNATGYSFPDLNGNRTPGTQVDIPEAGLGGSLVANIGGQPYTFSKTIDAVSAVLQRTSLSNEFSVEAAVGAGTDWVVTFPTKHHYVWDSQISSTGQRATFNAAGRIGAPVDTSKPTVVDVPAAGTYATLAADYPLANAGQANVAPFRLVSLWKGTNGNAKSEVPVSLTYLDREEKEVVNVSDISFSPRPSIPEVTFALSYESNIITFNNSNVLVAGDSYARYNWALENGFTSGWATINLLDPKVPGENVVTAANGIDTFPGLPAVGFATIKVANGDLNGVLSNYNAAWNHKSQ